MGILSSAALLILSLLNSVSLAKTGDEISELKAEREALIKENSYLEAEYQKIYSLPNIAEKAEEMGLQPCRPQQIEYLSLPGEG